MKEAVVRANIALHTALSETYDRDQPHYRPENRASVSRRLARLAGAAGSDRLVDFGCGSGFVIGLARPYFREIVGVDVTPAMLRRVDRSAGGVAVLQASTEAVPLRAETANVVAANSFLHHLFDVQPSIQEAYRLLKPGGVFYSEEDPNRDFWEAMKALAQEDAPAGPAPSEAVRREVTAVMDTARAIESQQGVEAHLVELAEYQKMKLGGMRARDLERVFRQAGFSRIDIEHYWYLGQASVLHRSEQASAEIETHLRLMLPLSRHLFKYLRIEAWK